MPVTAAIREFLVRLDDLVDAHDWPALDREVIHVGTGDDEALVRLPHGRDHDRDIEIQVDDNEVIVRYGGEVVAFTSRDEAIRFIEMLGDGRVELHVHRGLFMTTLTSHRDGDPRPFRRTRVPLPSFRPRRETRRFGFAD